MLDNDCIFLPLLPMVTVNETGTGSTEAAIVDAESNKIYDLNDKYAESLGAARRSDRLSVQMNLLEGCRTSLSAIQGIFKRIGPTKMTAEERERFEAAGGRVVKSIEKWLQTCATDLSEENPNPDMGIWAEEIARDAKWSNE
ncbi:MAG: hypothetical protein HOO67_01260 [Candidatus Peribacteraceae bacterium]|nr:hypothetical protein [Candidatus Peribacteraceae bacterium]